MAQSWDYALQVPSFKECLRFGNQFNLIIDCGRARETAGLRSMAPILLKQECDWPEHWRNGFDFSSSQRVVAKPRANFSKADGSLKRERAWDLATRGS
jgi:hypothetical protein